MHSSACRSGRDPVYVPRHPSEVLPGSVPLLGEPDEAFAAARALGRLAESCGAFDRQVRGARTQLARTRGRAVERVGHTLDVRAGEGTLRLGADAVAGQRGLADYGHKLESLRARAREIEAETSRQLAAIHQGAANSDTVGAALDRLSMLRRRWVALSEERREAEAGLRATLRARSPVGRVPRAIPGPVTSHAAAPAGGAAISVSGPSHSLSGVPTPGRHHPLLDKLYRDNATAVMLYGSPTAAQVEQWWQRLSSEDRERLIDNASLAVGNLNGVPLDERVRANAVTARYTCGYASYSEEQKEYLRKAERGEVQLVVYDPERSRLVEMFGTPSSNTAHVVTYIPGTGSLPKHFYRGEAQQVASYLVEHSEGRTVAFVYKDGPWVAWVGPNANSNVAFEAKLGSEIAGFQRDVIERDPNLAGAAHDAAAHSAGFSVLTGAELAGAHFDKVLSLAGAFALPGWAADPSTEYHHFQYDNDAINLIDGGRLFTPHELDGVFSQHIFDAAGRSQMESHSQIDDGPEVNRVPLEEMLNAIKEEQ